MNTHPAINQSEIKSYDNYLTAFFPEEKQDENSEIVTPKEVGVKMAEETLTHIQNLLAENKTA
jgi:hypothetical protein